MERLRGSIFQVVGSCISFLVTWRCCKNRTEDVLWMKVKTSQSNQERSSKLSPPQLTTLTLDNKLTNFLKQLLSSQMVANQLFAMEHNKIVSGTWAWAPHLEKQALQQIKGSFGLHGHKLSSSIIITDPHGPNSFIRPSLSTTRWR